MKKVTNRGKRSKTVGEVKPVGNIRKELQSFLETSPMQKEVFSSYKLQDVHMSRRKYIRLKEDHSSQRNYQNQFSHPG